MKNNMKERSEDLPFLTLLLSVVCRRCLCCVFSFLFSSFLLATGEVVILLEVEVELEFAWSLGLASNGIVVVIKVINCYQFFYAFYVESSPHFLDRQQLRLAVQRAQGTGARWLVRGWED